MELLIITFVGFASWLIVSAVNARAEMITLFGARRETLCASCIHAHIARGFDAGEELTFCTYAGVSRAVKFAVSECSMFCNRNGNADAPLVRIAGFGTNVDQSDGLRIAALTD